jgi:hypothetical protein
VTICEIELVEKAENVKLNNRWTKKVGSNEQLGLDEFREIRKIKVSFFINCSTFFESHP